MIEIVILEIHKPVYAFIAAPTSISTFIITLKL